MNPNDKIIFYGTCNVKILKYFLKEKLEIISEDLAIANVKDVAEKARNLELDINRLAEDSVHIEKANNLSL